VTRIFLSPPDVGDLERQALIAAFDSNWVTSVGTEINAFEAEVAEYVGARRAVAVSSGTAALHLALLGLGIGPGDVVAVPSFTFAATAFAVRYVGAEPVFIDCDESWTIDPLLLDKELAARAAAGSPVSAVLPVDLFGQSCDYDALLAICAEHGALVVEDAAEGLGATYRDRPVGGFGRAAALSFNGNKIVTTGGGGMLLTDDEDLADRAAYLATQARDQVLHYEHREIGFNYRMNNLLAAVGRAQFSRLPALVAARREIHERYAEAFDGVAGITLMPGASHGEPSWWLTCVEIDPDQFGADAQHVVAVLGDQGIEARPTWKPMHMQPVFEGVAMVGGDVCERLYRRGVCLPSGSTLSATDQDRVVAAVLGTP
jgi:dTDP-4-amino-4,6-dideoxygalactose transaminase